ncbi:MAG: hypothetical protein HN348_30025, partial [Proteobacteria bacterium]|nr:hypothetical protein [Pseudomonadota bacterium]
MSINPGKVEICFDNGAAEGVDNDCANGVDDGCPQLFCPMGGSVDQDYTVDPNTNGYLVDCNIQVQGDLDPQFYISDGVTLFFMDGLGLYIGPQNFSEYGELVIDGNDLGVVMTGWTEADEDPLEPGAWKGIQVGHRARASEIEGLDISYGGGFGGAIVVEGDDTELYISNSTISLSSGYGVEILAGTVRLEDNIIENNALGGVSCDEGCLDETPNSSPGNVISNNGGYPLSLLARSVGGLDGTGLFSGNDNDFIVIDGGQVSTTASWFAHDLVPYLVTSDISIGDSPSVTLVVEDGVEMHFDLDVVLNVGDTGSANFFVSGNVDGVVMTSAQGEQNQGDWAGIHIEPSAGLVAITGLTLSYAGSSSGYYDGGISIDGSYWGDFSLTDSFIEESAGSGLKAYGGPVAISGSSFLRNAKYGINSPNSWTIDEFSENIVSDNENGQMRLSATDVAILGDDSTFSATEDGADEIVVLAGVQHLLVADANWLDHDMVYRIKQMVTVSHANLPVLRLKDGAELAFDGTDVGLEVVGGSLVIEDIDGLQNVILRGHDESSGSWAGVELHTAAVSNDLRGFELRHGGAVSAGITLGSGV